MVSGAARELLAVDAARRERRGSVARLLPAASKCRLNCRDADDQKFIDLAVAEQALLLSKDRHILSMAKRLRALGVQARAAGLI